MADYYLSPYRLSITPPRRPGDEIRMGKLLPDSSLSAADAIANTWYGLSLEDSPRIKSDDSSRLLDIQRVERTKDQVICHCSVGVSGYQSRLELENSDVPITRNHNDTEWFSLRVFFGTKQGARAGMLIAERVGPYSVYGHVLELLRDAFKSNFPDGLMLRLDPVQDLSALGFALEDLTTRALEFRSVVKDEDISKNQGSGTPTSPLTRGSKRALRRITKFTRTGGLGSFRNFKGRDITDLAAEFGYTADTASTEVVATVITPSGKPRNISINDGRSSAVSFPIERNSSVNSPSQLEFIATLEEVISGTGDALGIPGLKVDALADFRDVEDYANIEKQWVINDEGSTL